VIVDMVIIQVPLCHRK